MTSTDQPHHRAPTSLATRAVHAGRDDLAALGVHAPPIDLSSTYPLNPIAASIEDMEAITAGRDPSGGSVYARIHNPTVARVERAIAGLEGAEEGVAFASGMAAMTATLLALCGLTGRRHVVAIRPLYGGTDALLASGLLGIETTFAPADGIAAAVRADTGAVILETPGNPTLDLVDIADVARQAGDVPVVVDGTFATPVLQRPLAHGAALVHHSATKALSGHGDVVGGLVCGDAARIQPIRLVRHLTGGILHPLAAFLLLRGLPTLPLRVERAQASAGVLAARLAAHPSVLRVAYPGLPGADPLGLIGRQQAGPGSILSFEVAGGGPAARRVVEAVRLATHAVSLGTTDTLVQLPAGFTHAVVDESARAEIGISDALVRLSVGLEDVEDIWQDLAAALASA